MKPSSNREEKLDYSPISCLRVAWRLTARTGRGNPQNPRVNHESRSACHSAILEGVFEHQEVIVKPDILQRRKEDHWRLVEAKSTADLKEHHLDDVAIQRYVLSTSRGTSFR